MTRYTATIYVSAPGNTAFPTFSGLTPSSSADGMVKVVEALLSLMDGEDKAAFLSSCAEAVIVLSVDTAKASAKATIAGKSVSYGLEAKMNNPKGVSAVAKASEKAISELTCFASAFGKKFDKWLFDSRKKWRAF